jgi:hypothetical protein
MRRIRQQRARSTRRDGRSDAWLYGSDAILHWPQGFHNPKALQDGDVIAVSKLSQRPMVLRRAEDSGLDHYAVIGSAFVENVHNGNEIFAAADEDGGIGTIHLV